ncbi:MAG: ATP-binding protein [Candidatus Pacebacteria bacterium]|nr:ATP-binding protein [Candidatus Paceibacterota bacterium]
MQYKSFHLENYRGIEKVDLDLQKNRILTLVGLNESGKTTILKSLELFYRVARGQTPNADEYKMLRPKGTDFTGSVELTASALLDETDKNSILKKWKEIGKKTTLEIGEEFTYTINFNFKDHQYVDTTKTVSFSSRVKGKTKSLSSTDKNSWVELIKHIRENLLPEILFYEDFIFDIPEKVLFYTNTSTPNDRQVEVDTELNKSWQSVLDDILVSVQPKSTSFQEWVADLWTPDHDTAAGRVLKMEGKLNETITDAWKDLFIDGGKKLNFKEIRLIPEQKGAYLEVSFRVITDANQQFSINERSKGCKWFFSFLLFTEFRKNRSRNILFLLDEPASNLHSKAQTKILDAIADLSDKSMVAYSTHSHHLIRMEWLPGTYVVMNENQSEKNLEGDMTFEDSARINALRYFTFVGEGYGVTKMSYCQPILDLLEYAPSAVEPVPNIVITEGKNDWFTFEYINNVIGLRKKYDFRFYPGAGKDQLWEIIRIYLSWGAPFVVMLDGDEGGEKAKSAYIEEFGDFIKERIFTLQDVLQKPFETEGVFNEAEVDRIIDAALGTNAHVQARKDAPALKSALNHSLSILSFKKESVLITKATKDQFEKIFSYAEEALSKQRK